MLKGFLLKRIKDSASGEIGKLRSETDKVGGEIGKLKSVAEKVAKSVLGLETLR
jgi:hypothetical protein